MSARAAAFREAAAEATRRAEERAPFRRDARDSASERALRLFAEWLASQADAAQTDQAPARERSERDAEAHAPSGVTVEALREVEGHLLYAMPTLCGHCVQGAAIRCTAMPTCVSRQENHAAALRKVHALSRSSTTRDPEAGDA